MTVTVSEAYFSRDCTLGATPQAEITYFTFGTADEIVAHQAAIDRCRSDWPDGYRGMLFTQARIKRVSEDVYECPCEFGGGNGSGNPPPPSSFDSTLSFNLIGGTTHITNGLVAPTVYRDSALVPSAMNFGGAIGIELSADGANARVRGVDVFTPIMDYSYETTVPDYAVTSAYVDSLFDLTGKVNSATFKGRAAGEVLFKGARGTKNAVDAWKLSFEFAWSKNETGLTVGSIGGISKLGWQYLDVLYVPSTSVNNFKIMKPGQVFVHTVYKTADLNAIGI